MKSLTPTPTGWSNNTDHCKWKGISCDSSRSVTSIMLPSSSFTGTLPTNINILTKLTHVDLHNNSLNGSLLDFSKLELLTISLGHNNFTIVPERCFRFTSYLRTLNLSNNLNLIQWEFSMNDLTASNSLETIDLEATNMIGSLQSLSFDLFPKFAYFYYFSQQTLWRSTSIYREICSTVFTT
ncbi:receptor kinase TMK4 [Trifolium repens]|nr:receptor kinase TMK4 [Trifolium repens]